MTLARHLASSEELTSEQLAAHGAQSIAQGSKSFALASLLFGKEMRSDVHMLYAWCRHCDDVIDGQTMGGDAPDAALTPEEQTRRLEILRGQTLKALRGEPTGEPAFDGFAAVAARHRLPRTYPMHLLDGFAHDVEGRRYETLGALMDYCYGVAGVVGVMMAIMMGVDKNDQETLDRACDLGIGFQLTNICRDVMDDAKGGRLYLPDDLLRANGLASEPAALLDPANTEPVAAVVAQVLAEADRYYASASIGARRLPLRAASAVLAARNIYRHIGAVVRARGTRAWDNRAFVSSPRKLSLAVSGVAAGACQALFLAGKSAPARDDLWVRPRDGVQ